MNYILKSFIIDIEMVELYKLSIRYYDVMCHFCNKLTIHILLQKFKFKLNQIKIKFNYSLFLGHGIIYILILVLFLINDIYIQVGIGLFICLDYIIKDFNNILKLNILTPSLNIYYPIFFSIFSVTIRITGVFVSLILGVRLCCLFIMIYWLLVWLYSQLIEYIFISNTYY